jgi:hypothetical protein
MTGWALFEGLKNSRWALLVFYRKVMTRGIEKYFIYSADLDRKST